MSDKSYHNKIARRQKALNRILGGLADSLNDGPAFTKGSM